MKLSKIKITTLAVFAGWFLCFSPAQAECQMSLDPKPATAGAFKAKLKASGLEKKHSYQLTINGYVGHSSNTILLEKYQNYQGEGYIDFKVVSTDANGVLTADIDIQLPKSQYRVKLLIKDINNDWFVVCSKDSIEFEVK